jgi:hypothetical protein
MHLLFTCPATQVIWQELGIYDIIQEASIIDLAGLAALEYILRDTDRPFPGVTDIGLKEVIVYLLLVHLVDAAPTSSWRTGSPSI